MAQVEDRGALDALRRVAQPLSGSPADFDALLRLTRDARCVLIGEATHGSEEFYRFRAELTKRLIVEQGFGAVAAEADWPDAYRVHRYVQGHGRDQGARSALDDFRRFPAWMWRNNSVLEFVRWLRSHNDARGADVRAGFYGLDLYSLHGSMRAVLHYLDGVDSESAQRARERYACFDHFGQDPQSYGYLTSAGLSPSCEREAIDQLLELQHERHALLARDGLLAEDEHFAAEQNARVVKNAERYYRAMLHGRVSSWNLRDTHMADTLDALFTHLEQRGGSKIVVWAHNSHVGDARATELGDAGEVTLGQLARERMPGEVRLIGFSTCSGSVAAASDWGGPVERKAVRPALAGSYEDLFHRLGVPRFLLLLNDPEVRDALREARLMRAIGVIYRPQTERFSHCFRTRLPDQLDAIMHIDQTSAVQPLEAWTAQDHDEAPETYPTGM
jgi:erythromycin esterase-like protein